MYTVLPRPGPWKGRSIWQEVLSLKESLVVNKDALIMFRLQLAHWLPADYSQPAEGFVGHCHLSAYKKQCSEHTAILWPPLWALQNYGFINYRKSS